MARGGERGGGSRGLSQVWSSEPGEALATARAGTRSAKAEGLDDCPIGR